MENKEIAKRLLQYLTDRTVDGSAVGLKEYTVGLDCFGKAEGYDPQTDSSVRVHLGKLRKLLEEYAQGEGREDTPRVVLPQRQFGLLFEGRPAPVSRGIDRRAWWGAAFAGAAGIGGGWWLAGLNGAKLSPSLSEFWSPLGISSQRTLVCLGTPLFLRFRGAFVRVPGQEDFESFANSELASKLGEALGDSTPAAGHEYTGAGEGSGAFLIAQTLARGGVYPEIRRSHLLTWEEIKNENVIFLGSAKNIPQLKQLPDPPHFMADRLGVLNSQPRPGEPEVFRGKRNAGGDLLEHHAVISKLWGPGKRGKLWVIGGSSTGAILAAVEAVCSEAKIFGLLGKLRGSKGELPESFDIVVKADFRQEVAVNLEYVTHRAR